MEIFTTDIKMEFVWTKLEHLIPNSVKIELEGFEKQTDVTEPMNETDIYIYGLLASKQIEQLRLRGK